MSRMLVTGGCGFLGSHFVRTWLQRYDEDSILNADALTYAGSLDNLEEAAKNKRHKRRKVDIADAAAMARVLTKDVDLIVHFAAETHVDRSLEDAGQFVRTNVLGTQTLLAGMLRLREKTGDAPALIVISTDEVYGPTPKGQYFGTGEALRPTSPYAASKAAADWMALSYARSFELDITIVRSVNVYGPRQYPEKLIPLFVTRALAGETMPLYGHGRQRRCWLYVDDFVQGLSHIIARPELRMQRPIWHLGSPVELPNMEIAQSICTACHADPSLITPVPDRPGHDQRYALDYSQTARVFGWQPQMSFAHGLAQTVGWIRDHLDWCEARTGWTPSFTR